jgi:hypothetical protein
MHKSATKCDETIYKWCKNKHGASKIIDTFETYHLSLMKSQAKIAFDKASKSHDLMKRVSILEDEVSSLVAKITHFDECDSFLVGIVESVCEMLLCKLP